MCGIFGFAGPFSFRSAALLQALAIADESRGKHSTGLAIAAKVDGKKRPSPLIVKKAMSGSEFVRSGYASALFRHRYGLAIGHNRFATSGEVNDRNAHPFRIQTPQGVAVAAHNGIVGGKEALAREFGVPNCPVDSEVLFRAIGRLSGSTERSLLDAIEQVSEFAAPTSDFACLWMEPSQRTLYLWRSEGRPLVIFDARRIGLGRFFASTLPIFAEAWGMVRGCLAPLRRVSSFEARPYSVYRIADDGKWDLERMRDLRIESRDSREEREDEEERCVLLCGACRKYVDVDAAVIRDGMARHRSCSA